MTAFSRLPILIILCLLSLSVIGAQGAFAASFPTIAGITNGNAGSAPSQTIYIPGGESAGDLFIVCMTTYTAGGAHAITMPSGWYTLVAPILNNVQFDCFFRFSTGHGGGVAVTMTPSVAVSIAYVAYRITGSDNLTAPLAVNPAISATNANPDPPSITGAPVTDRLYIVAFGWFVSQSLSSYPANYANSTSSASNGAAPAIAIAARNLNGGTENPGTAALSGSTQWIATTITVAPAIPIIASPGPTLDADAWIFLFLLLAYGALLFVGWYQDSALWLIPAGIVMFFLAFQGWNVTSSFLVVSALVTVALATIVIPIRIVIKEALE